MRGLGDNLYQRAFVRGLIGRDTYVDTPWPELYADLPVKFIKPVTNLRTQAKNRDRQPATTWHPSPIGAQKVRVAYGGELSRSSICKIMRKQFGCEPEFDLPPTPPVSLPEKFALIRPVTVRSEWRNEARNPRAEYIAMAANELRRRGYYVVSVADLSRGEEWPVLPLPDADLRMHSGEADVLVLMAMVKAAAVCIGGVGWLLPACVSAGTPLYVVQGGQGGHNAPERLMDAAMNTDRIGWARPRFYCECTGMQHQCNKIIKDFDHGFRGWLDGLGL